MGTWAALLIGLVGPIATRVMIALGFAYVSYEGAKGVVIAVLQNAVSSFGGMAAEVTALLARGGFFLALSIVSGGIIGGITYALTTRLTSSGPQAEPPT
jgi:hypothetical protein